MSPSRYPGPVIGFKTLPIAFIKPLYMSNEQVFIACVLSFLAGTLLIHYLGPAGKRARRLHKALTKLSLVHDTYYTESQEALIDLDKLSERLRVNLYEMRDVVDKQKRSIDLLHGENDLLREVIDEHTTYGVAILNYTTDAHRITAGLSHSPKRVDDLLKEVKRLADALISPSSNEQEHKKIS